jgi:D-amino-acid dehydrogenase
VSKKVVIVGAGIIGLSVAYYLQKEGHYVIIVDQSNLDSGASYVNAGYVSPSHLIPLSAPGVMKKGIKWMLNTSSPLYIKPRLDADLIKWAWAFNKSCKAAHVKKAIPVIRDISLLSQELFEDIKKNKNFNFHYEKKGLLMLCQTDKMLEEELKNVKIAKNEGLKARELSLDVLKKLEPNVAFNVKGATHFECDSHSTPQEFMEEMKNFLSALGVQFFINEKVEDFDIQGLEIKSLTTNKQVIKADEFVLAAGSWTGLLCKKVELKLVLQAGKGYCINVERSLGISIPAILAERKVAITPMNGYTRFAGTMEIAGINHHINKVRVNAIANAVNSYYPEIELSGEEKGKASCGLRPLSFDGLPYIGRSKKHKNLTIATGHAMMGWTMGTATGKLVSEIISDKKTSLNLEPFSIDRF